MAELRGDVVDRAALREQQGRERVPEVVRARNGAEAVIRGTYISSMQFWEIGAGERLPWDGSDGESFKWTLRRDGNAPSFTVVKISDHMLGGYYDPDRPTERAHAAVSSKGRSEVERYLHMKHPPRVIEVGTVGDPVVAASRE
jgi:hypothetical protein